MRKIKTIGVFISFILSFILHFMYELIPINIISIIAPVNESIWEHMKLIASSTLIFSIIEYLIYKKKRIPFNNFLLSYVVSITCSIIVYLIIYIPLFDIFGHNTFVAILLLFIIFIFLQILSYYIMNTKKIYLGKEIGILLIIIIYYIFGYFTYHPPKIGMFYDYANKNYGIIKQE